MTKKEVNPRNSVKYENVSFTSALPLCIGLIIGGMFGFIVLIILKG